jgi:hypothetical protein
MSAVYTCHSIGCDMDSTKDELLEDYFYCGQHGTCDICEKPYEVSDRTDHCGDCGTCWEHCQQPAHALPICGDCLAPMETNHPCLTAY